MAKIILSGVLAGGDSTTNTTKKGGKIVLSGSLAGDTKTETNKVSASTEELAPQIVDQASEIKIDSNTESPQKTSWIKSATNFVKNNIVSVAKNIKDTVVTSTASKTEEYQEAIDSQNALSDYTKKLGDAIVLQKRAGKDTSKLEALYERNTGQDFYVGRTVLGDVEEQGSDVFSKVGGFVKEAVKSVAGTAARTLTNGGNSEVSHVIDLVNSIPESGGIKSWVTSKAPRQKVLEITGFAKQTGKDTVNLPIVGEISYKYSSNPRVALGQGIEDILNVATGGEGAAALQVGKQAVKKTVSTSIKTFVKNRAAEFGIGAVYGMAGGLETEDASAMDVARSSLMGGLLGSVIGLGARGVARVITNSADKKISYKFDKNLGQDITTGEDVLASVVLDKKTGKSEIIVSDKVKNNPELKARVIDDAHQRIIENRSSSNLTTRKQINTALVNYVKDNKLTKKTEYDKFNVEIGKYKGDTNVEKIESALNEMSANPDKVKSESPTIAAILEHNNSVSHTDHITGSDLIHDTIKSEAIENGKTKKKQNKENGQLVDVTGAREGDWRLGRNEYLNKYPDVIKKEPWKMSWIEQEKVYVQGKLLKSKEFEEAKKVYETTEFGTKESRKAGKLVQQIDHEADVEIGDLVRKSQTSPEALAKLNEYKGNLTDISQHEELRSRAYERAMNELPEENRDSVMYEPKHIKEQMDKAVERINKNPEQAMSDAMNYDGEKWSMEKNLTNIALSEKALEEGDLNLYKTLTKRRSLELTAQGQAIASEIASVRNNDTSKFVKQLLDNRMTKWKKGFLSQLREKITNKKGKTQVTEIINEKVKSTKEKVDRIAAKKFDIAGAQKLLDSLACKL